MKPPFWTRYLIISAVFVIVAIGIVIQMVRIQNLPGTEIILAQSESYAGVTQTVYPDRGTIYDRWGHLLAGNETTYEIGLDLFQISDPETIATVCASVLGLDYSAVLASARTEPGENDLYYIVIDDFVSFEKVEQLSILKTQYAEMPSKRNFINPSLSGLTWSVHTKRSYPEGKLASNLLGFYGFLDRLGGRGFFGIEETYNDMLSGTPQKIYKAYDPQLVEAMQEIPAGSSLILTIDREIQSMTETVLDEAVDWSGAEAGTIIVYDPEDGSILAMATTPRLDPNEYWNYSEVFPNPTPFNRAVSKSYEPGSVFKVITMASALDAGAVTPDTHFYDPGYIEVGGYYINNWDGGAWGDQDMTGCMQHSLNVCLSWVASELGAEKFYQYIRNFGFDRNTGVDLAGEIHWPIRVPGDSQWYEVDLATNSFGQGIAVTPIQMVMAVGALANEGKMMLPHVVKSMIIDGHQYEINPVVVGTPIKSETASTITEMLANSLENESSNALVDGYRLAGKTGTAEIPTQYGYSSETTHTSFVGWGPVEDPKFLVYVWLEKPEISIWGSEVAAPVFQDIVERLVVLLDLPPDSVRQKLVVE
jgi:cell division protein FtsI/penicillin-binding protein 2